ncbi:unnamed protein product [Arabis nemorensis]|uniref:Reverse transcriptase zinc-binding domain-containing protein n=1 Tax=Arabis nemorensis TaxID=586526 RepID=A0A565ARQ3_9BRAS|nr:unnamed protein product [Arabis nemorensis]
MKGKIKKSFMFINCLLEFIKLCWPALNFSGTHMFCLSRKLKELKGIIRNFSKQNFSNLELRGPRRYDKAAKRPAIVQERQAHRKWMVLAEAEESFLRQRSRVKSYADGDANTAFFHLSIISRSARNHIHFLVNDYGNIIYQPVEIKRHIVGFYENLLGSHVSQSTARLSDLQRLVKFKCSETDCSASVTASDVRIALFSLPSNKTPAAASNSVGWLIRPARSPIAEDLQVYLTTSPLPADVAVTDHYSWHIVNRATSDFSTASTWEALRTHYPIQPWTKHIWFSGAVPKHAFTMWTATLDRLPTRSRMARWCSNNMSSCCLCNDAEETRDHLLLRCDTSRRIWNMAMRRLRTYNRRINTWSGLLSWLSESTNAQTSPQLLRRLVAQSIVYHIWQERNARLHSRISTPSDPIFKRIGCAIRHCILATRKQRQFVDLMHVWLFNS